MPSGPPFPGSKGTAAPPGQASEGGNTAETSTFPAGNLTSDPELRYTTSGTARATFRVAVAGRVRDGEGWRDGESAFYAVVVWRDQAVHAAESLGKGSRVVVVGRLQQRSWQADGTSRSAVEGGGRRAGAEPAVGDHDQGDAEPGQLVAQVAHNDASTWTSADPV